MHCTDMNIEVLNKVEVDRYGEHCMTLLSMYHRAMITVDRPIDSYFVLSFLSRDRGIIGRLIRDRDHRSIELE